MSNENLIVAIIKKFQSPDELTPEEAAAVKEFETRNREKLSNPQHRSIMQIVNSFDPALFTERQRAAFNQWAEEHEAIVNIPINPEIMRALKQAEANKDAAWSELAPKLGFK